MNAKTTRILKEARPLFWPWCAVMIAGALPLASGSHTDWTEAIGAVGFFGGIPLLATLAFGNEFQHRTLSLLLSQPIDRMEIWREKSSITVVAVFSAAMVFYYGWRSALQQDPTLRVFAGVFVIVMIASATFWTLFARSTMGGFFLNGLALDILLLSLFIVGRALGYWTALNWDQIFGATPWPGRSIATLCYAGVMLWLGRRTLARFQVTGGMAGDDWLMVGPSVMPEALAGWFRCRPSGAVLNLIRKELRLLRPLWLITLLAAVAWTCLTMLGLAVPRPGSAEKRSGAVIAVSVLGLLTTLILPVLAGSLSLGEERTSGTHSWHMTLPVSARRQWLVKLLMALFAGFVCAVLLPVLVLSIAGLPSGSPFMIVDLHVGMLRILCVLLLSLASFWCASAVNGTARAAMWVFPMLIGLGLAGEFGGWVAQKLTDLALSRFNPFADFGFTNAVSNIQIFGVRTNFMLLTMLFLVPTLLVAVIQSYRLFRSQVQDSILSVVRNLLPLAAMAFVGTFCLLAFLTLVGDAQRQMWTMFYETHEAIEKVSPGTPNLDAAHPLQLTGEDLAKAGLLSEQTRRWLGNATIKVAPAKAHVGAYTGWRNSGSIHFPPEKAYSWYLATFHLPSGFNCTLAFMGEKGYGVLGGVCK